MHRETKTFSAERARKFIFRQDCLKYEFFHDPEVSMKIEAASSYRASTFHRFSRRFALIDRSTRKRRTTGFRRIARRVTKLRSSRASLRFLFRPFAVAAISSITRPVVARRLSTYYYRLLPTAVASLPPRAVLIPRRKRKTLRRVLLLAPRARDSRIRWQNTNDDVNQCRVAALPFHRDDRRSHRFRRRLARLGRNGSGVTSEWKFDRSSSRRTLSRARSSLVIL